MIEFPLRMLNAVVLAFSPLMVSVMLAITLYTFLFENKVGIFVGIVIVKAGIVFGVMLAIDHMRKYKRVDNAEANDDVDGYDFYSNADYWDERNKGK